RGELGEDRQAHCPVSPRALTPPPELDTHPVLLHGAERASLERARSSPLVNLDDGRAAVTDSVAGGALDEPVRRDKRNLAAEEGQLGSHPARLHRPLSPGYAECVCRRQPRGERHGCNHQQAGERNREVVAPHAYLTNGLRDWMPTVPDCSSWRERSAANTQVG